MSTPITYRDLLIDRYRLVFDWVPDGAGRVLDVGCGNAHFTQWLRRKCSEVCGVDHNERNCEQGRAMYPGLHLVAAPAERLPFPDASFDCVVSTDTIEHTDDAAAAAREMLRVLKPGGTLVLTAPQGGLFGWLDAENLVNGSLELIRRLRLPKRGGGRRLERFRFRRHRHYTLARLRKLLGPEAEIVRVYRGGLFLYPFLYLIEKGLEAVFRRNLVETDYRLMRRLRALDFRCPWGPLAFNIAILAQKTGSHETRPELGDTTP